MADQKNLEKSLEEDRGVESKKKTKKHKDQTWAKEGPQDPFEMLDSLSEEKQQEIQKALHLFSFGHGPPKNLQEAQRHTYRFWDTQPVPKIDEKVTSHGPIESERPSVREEPFSLPQEFIWDTLNLDNQEQLRELCVLLNENYTEEDDNTLRLHYSPQFLLWTLCPPGWQSQWHCGVRVKSSQKLVGFISAIPATIKVLDTDLKMVEVNFLCVHKKLRSKRVAPVLIKELTRRVHQQGISQAIYSTSAVLPKPIASCRYWHRSLNPRKLIELNFSSLTRNMTLQRAIKLNRLPETMYVMYTPDIVTLPPPPRSSYQMLHRTQKQTKEHREQEGGGLVEDMGERRRSRSIAVNRDRKLKTHQNKTTTTRRPGGRWLAGGPGGGREGQVHRGKQKKKKQQQQQNKKARRE
ncbi:glycylpeptide N-tetradecanoyltransferase 1b isoform X2 [Carassius gibelio]|uniref:glycylpeptide N-tetradecanoyltransferase 1b isoform X2 n=1 Tax=Carassius gibelio TaxID=101364 RepID=UPI0022795178|nr:glycylpeptide N-tetradecanoyltransferase 1b isoform X2 [Carassius gibelio]